MREVDRLATPGHMDVARQNAITWIPRLGKMLFALSLVYAIYGNTYGTAKKLASVDTAPPTLWERFEASPWKTITGQASALLEQRKPPRPVLDASVTTAINPIPPTPLPGDKLTSMADLAGYVQSVTDSLNSTGKLSDRCEPLKDLRAPWVDANGLPNVPLCLTSTSGDVIWMASIVNATGNAMYPVATPWLGVFHRDGGKWKYANMSGLIGRPTALIPTYTNLTSDLIPYQIAHDFPYLVVRKESK
ncbi:hypothetical protein J4G52_24405 [Burkholderia cenocepacia]|uniref:hypothetical protein n=1 Tax=Burkholderia cenocepacia TaxID=95486 RepID=UPI001AA1ACFA|nr:hypothetical protein [Burkholderia cenocepacia]MBO1856684.1 hypothetical protein [Burkholderia cenocepacia]